MFTVLGLISTRKNDLVTFFVLIGLSCFTVASDRMIGLLLSLTLIAAAVLQRSGKLAVLAAVTGALFLSLLIPELLFEERTEGIEINAGLPKPESTTLNYLVLFGVLNGVIAIPAILGLQKSRKLVLIVPVAICGLGALSWVMIPEPGPVVPERWAVLFGVFASIPAGFFVAKIFWRHRNRTLIAGVILSGFGIMAVGYATLPYESPLIILSLTRNHIEEFMPVTMQFNALDVNDNEEILSAISRINSHTEKDAVIVGAKHWRGFMALNLEDNREYKFSEDPRSLAMAYSSLGKQVYLFVYDKDGARLTHEKIEDSDRR
jgi:hypothetical protein